LAMDFSPGRKFGFVLGLESLFFVPPGAAAVEVISNIGGADHGHRQSIAQIF